MIRNLIFDLDGTLVDSCSICVAILSEMLAQRGSELSIDPVAARPFMSVGGETMVAALLGTACGDPPTEIAEFRRRYAKWMTPAESLFPDVATGIAALEEAGYRMAICSNKPQNLCDNVLRDTGLDRHFASVVGSRDGLAKKPARDLIDAALADLNAHPQDCLFIGDSEIDCRTAEAAGIEFLYVSYGYAEPGWHPGGSNHFGRFADVTSALLLQAQSPSPIAVATD